MGCSDLPLDSSAQGCRQYDPASASLPFPALILPTPQVPVVLHTYHRNHRSRLIPPPRVRKKICLPRCLRVLVSCVHDWFGDVFEALSSSAPFPFTLHTPNGVQELLVEAGYDIDCLVLLLRLHASKRW